MVGSVVDSSQGAVAGAKVTLAHLATGATTELVTGDRGQFRTPPLRIGEYSISIEADGFKRFTQTGVVLDIGDLRQVDAVLEVGQVSDSVSVQCAAPLLQTADATVATVIGNQQIENLPLNGRDYLQLAALSSGTIPSTSGVGISIGGQGGTAVAFLLDGMDNNSQTILPTHGNQKEVITPYKRNDFGASIGGPIVRNKLFLFGDFEIQRVRQSSTQVDNVPTLNQRNGIFSSTIYDPLTYNAATNTRSPFPGTRQQNGSTGRVEINPPNHLRVNLSTSQTNPTLQLATSAGPEGG
ncbi:MAG TPA: carboxypeptidase-like regulatory domain-containing protein [Bryobacteraceae bacterium]|nr:carboxypeptidase-like regulatory domain-containing protein [Bryobacteraceae bacterium]